MTLNAKRALKVAILGNMNNYPLLLAEGLIVLGHEVKLVFNRGEVRHRPESKYPQFSDGYPSWLIDGKSCNEKAIIRADPHVVDFIAPIVSDADFVVLNDVWHAVSDHIAAPKISMLTGSDLTFFANYTSIQSLTSNWDPEFTNTDAGTGFIRQYEDFVTRQRNGILRSNLVNWPYEGLVPEGDKLLCAIGVSEKDRIFMLLSDTVLLRASPLPSPSRALRIFLGARIDYRQPANEHRSTLDLKGIDIFLKGFAEYLRTGGRGALRLVRKGKDIEAACELIRHLEIDEHIFWIDQELSLEAFHEEVRRADLVCDQFGDSFPGMVTLDAYALGRPVLANFKREAFAKHLPEPMPGFHVTTAADIAHHLREVERNPMLLQQVGSLSRLFAENYFSPVSVATQLIRRLSGRAEATHV